MQYLTRPSTSRLSWLIKLTASLRVMFCPSRLYATARTSRPRVATCLIILPECVHSLILAIYGSRLDLIESPAAKPNRDSERLIAVGARSALICRIIWFKSAVASFVALFNQVSCMLGQIGAHQASRPGSSIRHDSIR